MSWGNKSLVAFLMVCSAIFGAFVALNLEELQGFVPPRYRLTRRPCGEDRSSNSLSGVRAPGTTSDVRATTTSPPGTTSIVRTTVPLSSPQGTTVQSVVGTKSSQQGTTRGPVFSDEDPFGMAIQYSAKTRRQLAFTAKLLDERLVPKAWEVSKEMPGFAVPQLIFVDVSLQFVSMARNLIRSARHFGLAHMVLVLASNARVCKALKDEGVACANLEPLVKKASTITGASLGKRDIRPFFLVRQAAMWRILRSGLGVLRLDSDMLMLRNVYTDVPQLGSYDFFYHVDVNYCAGASKEWRIPFKPERRAKKPNTQLCVTRTPPEVAQPAMAGYYKAVVGEFLQLYPQVPLLEGSNRRLLTSVVRRETDYVYELAARKLRLAELKCEWNEDYCRYALNQNGTPYVKRWTAKHCARNRTQVPFYVHAKCFHEVWAKKVFLRDLGVKWNATLVAPPRAAKV